MADLVSDDAVFSPGETVSLYTGRDETLPLLTTAVAAADGSVSFVNVPPAQTYTLRGQASGVRRRMYAHGLKDASGSLAIDDPYIETPNTDMGSKATILGVANRAWLTLLPRAARGRVLTGIQFIVSNPAPAGDSIDIGVYQVTNGGLTRISSSGAKIQRVNLPFAQDDLVDARRASLGVPPVRLPVDDDSYLALAYGPVNGANAASFVAVDMGLAVYMPGSPELAPPGKVKALYKDSAYTLPATIIEPPSLEVAPALLALFTRRMVTLGDSITRGSSGANQNYWNYPGKLATRLGPYATIVNAGDSGDTTAGVIARLNRDITSQYPHEVVVLIGVNDINSGGLGSATVIANLQTIIAGIRAAGGTPIMLTILPFGNTAIGGGWNATKEGNRAAINSWILNTSGERAINMDPIMGDFTNPAQPVLLAAYDSGDGLHPNGTGYDVMASTVFSNPAGFNGRRTASPD